MHYSRFLVVMPVLCVLFMHISLVQLLAFNPETGNVTVKCLERERQALLALKRGFRLYNDWLPLWENGEIEKGCCNWEGVQCSSKTGHVLKLDLHGHFYPLDPISPSLGELHHLNYLDLSSNILSYTSIPNFIGSLTHLRYLNLSRCSLEGEIPRELGNLFFLEYLDLSYNFLYGGIPHQFSKLSHLVHLDLSWNFVEGRIPPQLGSLLSLKYLDLSLNHFTGTIPHHFGNLSNLQYLDLNSFGGMPLRSDLQWISHLLSIRHLSLSEVNLGSANTWHQLVSGLSHLQYLDLSDCNILDSIPSSLSSAANFSTSLSYVDLSYNYLMKSSLIFPWLMNSANSLAILKLNYNGLKGTIPEAFGNFSSLEQLDLANNLQLQGQVPLSLFHICNLREIDLSNNRLTGKFHEFVQTFSPCAHRTLQTLNLGWNKITGMVPDLSRLSSLQVLQLDSNGLNGTLNEGIGQLANLVELSLQNNSLEGLISEAHFSRSSKLIFLDLSNNNALVFNISNEWVPTFNLRKINLASCILGPLFPRWLRTQENIEQLDISCAKIADTIPNWFWDLLSMMENLNISHNQIRGQIENLPLMLPSIILIDLSSNLFEGPIPAFLSMTTGLFLSNNIFSMANLLLCANTSTQIEFLDLSNNHIRGELPECGTNFQSLVFLDLSGNYFDGILPRTMGSLRYIQSLHLTSNNFSGEIPWSLINCTELKVFDVAQNNLFGPLPSWIGNYLQKLLVLSMHSNKFHGSIPLSICHLDELHLLDLSLNNLSGNIPKCIGNLSAMANQAYSNATINYGYYEYDNDYSHTINNFRVYDDFASLIWKGKMSKYRSTLGLLRSVDFSSNRLIGKIPSGIMSLVGLISLNISRNLLSGQIPATIGQLKSLDFLDLSKNQLSGRIPSQLSQIPRLSVLNLSYNDLSGEIPLGTQLQTRDASAYIGNPKLCGAPLTKTCLIHGHHTSGNDVNVVEQFFTMRFYIAMAIGFILGFWGVCCSLILKKSWRYAYFKFLSDVYDKLYVLVAIKMAKLQRIRS